MRYIARLDNPNTYKIIAWALARGKKDPVKKNMDKFHKPKTHKDKTKYERKKKSKELDLD